MKLSYRGVNYEAEPMTLEVTEGEIAGTYRSHPWRVHHATQPRYRFVAPLKLLYRGVTYRRSLGN